MLPEDIAVLPLVRQITAAMPDCLVEAHHDRDELTLVAKLAHWQELAAWLQRESGYQLMCDLTCVDWYPATPRFELVCTVYALERHEFLRIKTRVAEDTPAPSLTTVWPAANWFEREVYDLFGVRFQGHPNLIRIMMPEDWTDHPMRKDYPVEGYR